MKSEPSCTLYYNVLSFFIQYSSLNQMFKPINITYFLPLSTYWNYSFVYSLVCSMFMIEKHPIFDTICERYKHNNINNLKPRVILAMLLGLSVIPPTGIRNNKGK